MKVVAGGGEILMPQSNVSKVIMEGALANQIYSCIMSFSVIVKMISDGSVGQLRMKMDTQLLFQVKNCDRYVLFILFREQVYGLKSGPKTIVVPKPIVCFT